MFDPFGTKYRESLVFMGFLTVITIAVYLLNYWYGG